MCTNYLNSGNENLIGYFKFNECGGTLLTDSQNGYDGVLIGMEGDEWMESDACPAYTVNFIVTEDPGAVPLEGATVNMSGTIRYTDDSGLAGFDGYESGSYEYTVIKDGYVAATGSFDLIDEDMTIEVSLLYTSINNNLSEEIQIYPNPVSGVLNIRTNLDYKVEIMDISGRLVRSDLLINGENQINLSNQTPGIYYMRLVSEMNVQVKKIMIR